jgi:hypothetical protein
MASAATIGSTRGLTPVSGSRITWRAMEFTIGLMGEFTRGSTQTIRSTGLVFTRGRTAVNMRGTGPKGNSMD